VERTRQWLATAFSRERGHHDLMDVNEVLLPGVGLRYEFTNADGDHIAIVARREGTFEIGR
jgi:hypothetical protein